MALHKTLLSRSKSPHTSKLIGQSIISLLLCLSLASHLNAALGQSQITVTLPDTLVAQTTALQIPVSVSELSTLPIISFEISVSYDPAIIEIEEIITSEGIASSFLFLNNLTTPGQAIVAAAGIDTLRGEGPMFFLKVNFLQDGVSSLTFDKVSFDVPTVDIVSQDGRIRNVSLSGIEDTPRIDNTLQISSNFPNPVRTRASMLIDSPEPATVYLKVYNIMGQLLHTSAPQPLSAGSGQQIGFQTDTLPPGQYFYRVVAQGNQITRYGTGKLTIVK